jgi:hypothetical protein
MKKIAKKVAILLILVMIASSFTGCFSIWAVTGEPPIGGNGYEIILYILVLPVDLPVAGTILIVKAGIQAARNKRGKAMEGIDTFSAHFGSLPETELDFLTQRISSLNEEEITPFTETVESFSEREISALAEAFSNLSEAEIASSIEALNSMSEESLITMLNNLQHIEFRYQD